MTGRFGWYLLTTTRWKNQGHHSCHLLKVLIWQRERPNQASVLWINTLRRMPRLMLKFPSFSRMEMCFSELSRKVVMVSFLYHLKSTRNLSIRLMYPNAASLYLVMEKKSSIVLILKDLMSWFLTTKRSWRINLKLASNLKWNKKSWLERREQRKEKHRWSEISGKKKKKTTDRKRERKRRKQRLWERLFKNKEEQIEMMIWTFSQLTTKKIL